MDEETPQVKERTTCRSETGGGLEDELLRSFEKVREPSNFPFKPRLCLGELLLCGIHAWITSCAEHSAHKHLLLASARLFGQHNSSSLIKCK
jgi:hypothetical protein